MGLLDKLFKKEPPVDVEQEYGDLLNALAALARTGAGFGQYRKFFMYVGCSQNIVYLTIEVHFGINDLDYINSMPGYLNATLKQLNITKHDYEFLMNLLQIKKDGDYEYVGESGLMQIAQIKNSHARPLFEAIKNRLVNTPHTTHILNNAEMSISLHDE